MPNPKGPENPRNKQKEQPFRTINVLPAKAELVCQPQPDGTAKVTITLLDNTGHKAQILPGSTFSVPPWVVSNAAIVVKSTNNPLVVILAPAIPKVEVGDVTLTVGPVIMTAADGVTKTTLPVITKEKIKVVATGPNGHSVAFD